MHRTHMQLAPVLNTDLIENEHTKHIKEKNVIEKKEIIQYKIRLTSQGLWYRPRIQKRPASHIQTRSRTNPGFQEPKPSHRLTTNSHPGQIGIQAKNLQQPSNKAAAATRF